ncbi:hypothetical protein [Streptomyces seoulensis]|uniref:hypothetical protein n=1 Tax=Streptomyces seoulensis TaxID=73044 RepID=UPI001FCBB7A2|nr:hypothetical protein [Streptomyces seoulensis]BDH07042.1 hypothetical protein HEK131_42690 [Streptomyces seoulensis]
MDELDAARLQIYSCEPDGPEAAICIVRCVGGIVRVGQDLYFSASTSGVDVNSPMRLNGIIRYEKQVDFVDPPNSAKVYISGVGVARLEHGVIITARQAER